MIIALIIMAGFIIFLCVEVVMIASDVISLDNRISKAEREIEEQIT